MLYYLSKFFKRLLILIIMLKYVTILLILLKGRIFMNRIIIFTGKGGVGKSSVAAAHALASSKSSKKTLLVSADAAHNLGDIFQIDIG